MAKPYKLRRMAEKVGNLEEIIIDTLNRHNGVQKEAADALGISSATLSDYLAKNGYVRITRYVHQSAIDKEDSALED